MPLYVVCTERAPILQSRGTQMYKENASCSRLQTVPCSGRWGKKGCFFAFLIFLKGKFVFLFFSFIPLEVFLLGGGGGGEIDGGDGNTRRSGRNEIRERKRFLSLFRFYFPPPPLLLALIPRNFKALDARRRRRKRTRESTIPRRKSAPRA